MPGAKYCRPKVRGGRGISYRATEGGKGSDAQIRVRPTLRLTSGFRWRVLTGSLGPDGSIVGMHRWKFLHPWLSWCILNTDRWLDFLNFRLTSLRCRLRVRAHRHPEDANASLFLCFVASTV